MVGINLSLKDEERCVIKLTIAPYAEQDAENSEQMKMIASEEKTKWSELTRDRLHSLVAGHFKGAVNVSEEKPECDNFSDFHEYGDPQIVQWVMGAIYKSEVLTSAEVKNS
jgi:hypothetical protein